MASDRYQDLEILADQVGDGSVKTFTFSKPVDMVIARCVGDVGRLGLLDDTPTVAKGIYCGDGENTYIPVGTEGVKVFAPVTVILISMSGLRY